MSAHVHDLVGIGIGPFGLGLAALADPLDDVDAVFLDQRDGFAWHPGMMLEGATIQVPFLADLVTMADPTSPYSFLSFLKDTGRLYSFYIRESFTPLRSEYDDYCRWVAAQLGTLRWRRRVVAVQEAGSGLLRVRAEVLGDGGAVLGTEEHLTRHVAVSVGTAPTMPPALSAAARTAAADPSAGPVVHSGDYLAARESLLESGAVTIVGSGQSAAEVYRDLIEEGSRRGTRVDWVTRSPRFFPMEYTKLSLEMTSPEYTDLFRSLSTERREALSRSQRALHKGISGDLVDDIHETLYRLSAGGREVPTTLLTETAVEGVRRAEDGWALTLRHGQLGTSAVHRTRAILAATGYAPRSLDLLDPLGDRLRRDEQGRPAPDRDYALDTAGQVHLLGTEEHTHGVTAPDLGFGPWRASRVLAQVTGREPYRCEQRIAFQTFGLPDGDQAPAAHRTLQEDLA
ncbi:lysine N(6)-hydroxylase/L-ornithine N(5)-oxygenase family protein [Brachybacterium sp. YJGR34]|uniref:lysine N(6)-hydroxylase/L-ornithine N(5)-oxygenase family protein n=1 Tax=Brachybacterium sp. YJGR34 TaxID=2059911 RepID=UPI000E0B1731|nr:SidA/IucD/PvdA family monooxygenase [Brachybacterium sp. YJGR34]